MLLRRQCGLLVEIRWQQCEVEAETVACSKTAIALVEDSGCVWAADLVRRGHVGCGSASRVEAEAKRATAKVLSGGDVG